MFLQFFFTGISIVGRLHIIRSVSNVYAMAESPSSLIIIISVTRLGNFSKPLATINLPKSLKFFGNFCKGVNIFNFTSEIIFGQLL